MLCYNRSYKIYDSGNYKKSTKDKTYTMQGLFPNMPHGILVSKRGSKY